MADPTEITVRPNEDPVTAEHPICGDRFEADADASPVEQVHDAACWAADHADCRCLQDSRE